MTESNVPRKAAMCRPCAEAWFGDSLKILCKIKDDVLMINLRSHVPAKTLHREPSRSTGNTIQRNETCPCISVTVTPQACPQVRTSLEW